MSADRSDSPPSSRRGLAGRVLGGRYRVTRMVSAGANTLIADAHDTEVDRPVTVKLIRPELAEQPDFRERFRAEMRIVSSLSHPNIAAVHDFGEDVVGKRRTVYVVVEQLSGGSLRDLRDRGRDLDPSQALLVGLEACRGLDFAHRKGLTHSELTPSKLVFGDDRRLRIVDFGLAHLLAEHDWREPSRVATHVARYASPEQAQARPIDGKSDVYSLGLILVEAVTGQVPFAANSTVATLTARVGKLMPVSADLGPLASVLERAGRPEPADRWTAAELGRALVRAAERLPRPKPIPIVVVSPFEEDP
ncbi:MAG: serine/threonine protein kinase, partial [Acidimicrobiia bacterium]|nr:serine/threonine protein kinase [Acidimicrobiia bacterium]